MIRNAKKMYYRSSFSKYKNNLRNTWKLINGLMSRNSGRHSVKTIVVDGLETQDESQIANYFNEYFSNVAVNLESEIPSHCRSPSDYVTSNVPNSFFISPISQSECVNLICDLKNTTCKLNVLPVKILKLVADLVCFPLCKLINLSVERGIFPDILKSAEIIPVFKKDDSKIVSNYRPIAILPLFSKIFEKFFTNRLISFLNCNNIISPCQFGFQRGVSTENALTTLTKIIYDSLNSKSHNINVFIDLQKAFDTVNHKILLEKLFHYGVRGLALDYISSYLTGRSQCVRIGNCMSSVVPTNVGIPQGSVTGPILFLLYINDLPQVSSKFKSILFADDTTLCAVNPNFNDLIRDINCELEKIKVYFEVNRLSLNIKKTFAMLFTNRFKDVDHSLSVSFDGGKIKFKDSEKFLGVIIDDRLSFANHITYLCSKISKFVGIFYRIASVVPEDILINLYHTFVYPYLIYGSLVWGGVYEVHLNRIFLLQKKLVRIITESDYLAHSDPLFYRTGILKISDVYIYLTAIHMFKKNIKGELNTVSNLHNYPTRSNTNVPSEFQRLSVAQKSLAYAAPTIWNRIPVHIKSIPKLTQFKVKLKKFLIDKYCK